MPITVRSPNLAIYDEGMNRILRMSRMRRIAPSEGSPRDTTSRHDEEQTIGLVEMRRWYGHGAIRTIRLIGAVSDPSCRRRSPRSSGIARSSCRLRRERNRDDGDQRQKARSVRAVIQIDSRGDDLIVDAADGW